ncbi:MAG: hypothetical protein ACOY3P_14155 [Planctomycetota bacterium]
MRRVIRSGCVRLVLAVVVLGLSGAISRSAEPGGPSQELAKKDAFTLGFPQSLSFRGEMIRPAHTDYATWSGWFDGTSGVIRKFVPEELPGIHPESHSWANRYAGEHPQKLILLHLNGEGRQVLDYPDVHRGYFPGHWVYEPGSMLTADVGPGEAVLKVDNARPFKTEAYIHRDRRGGGKSYFPHHVILVPVDAQGQRQWYDSEYAIVSAVDYDTNRVTVDRGQLFSKARGFQGGRTYVAPLAAGVWGGKPMWFYNLASVCPKDRSGRNAADVFVSEIAEWFAPQGRLHGLDGIAFDVNYFKLRDQSWDTNNDGVSDGGVIDGKNVWREGDWHFLTSLRKALGDDVILSADGHHPENQQAVGVLDGIESEGLVQHNDGFRGFSRMVNTHLYWQQYNNRPLDFRYVVLKLMHPEDAKRGEQLRRFATGAACCLGALVTDAEEDYLPAKFAEPGALGKPVGPLMRPARQTPDLLAGLGTPAGTKLAVRLKCEGCAVQPDDKGLLVLPSGSGAETMELTLPDLALPAGDVTLFVEMESLEPLEGFSTEDRVPRLVRAEFSKLPDYGEGRYNEYHTDLYGYIGTHGPSLMAFYLRRPQAGAEQINLKLIIEGRGRARLRSVTAHLAPDVLAREFERGVVLVNPALSPMRLPLGKFLPGVRGVPTTVNVPALDSVFVAKP